MGRKKEELTLKAAKYRTKNPERFASYARNRRAVIRSLPGVHTEEDIKLIAQRQKWKCANTTCRVSIKSGYHVDHIIPVAQKGSNAPQNLQLLCPPCNMQKGAKHPTDWARENGLLL